MSDRIVAKILAVASQSPIMADEVEVVAKQIRQQIGRENSEKITRIVSAWWNGTQHNPDELVDILIHEVCQLGEQE